MPTFGLQPRPRLLVCGYPELANEVSDLFPTIVVVQDLREVDQDEYDVLVVDGEAGWGLRVNQLVIGGGGAAPDLKLDIPVPISLAFDESKQTVSKVLEASDDLPDEVSAIVSSRLVPILLQRPSNNVIRWEDHFYRAVGAVTLPPLDEVVEPFVSTANGDILAGRFHLYGGDAECWYLPELEVDEVIEWVRAASVVWQRRFPEAFPRRSRWAEAPEWRTPAEDAINDRIQVLRTERNDFLARVEALELELEEEMDTATSHAEQGMRRLLRSSGDELVDAVKACLDALGFITADMDAVQPKGEKVEDLRVQDLDAEDWIALVEIKGYKSAAKSNDLLLFGKFIGRFGGQPGDCWYIVNQFAGEDPSQRPSALAAKESELATFADALNGLVIDTAELYRVWKAVEAGSLPASEARAVLRQSRGRFVYSPTASSGA